MSQKVKDYLLIVLGTFITGFSIACFITPAKIAAGGLNGFATILYYLLGIDTGLTILLCSIPLFAVGMRIFGRTYGIKSLMGVILLSLFTTLFGQLTGYQGFLDYSDKVDILCSGIFGGFLTGAGIGLVMRTGANTGGTDIIAQIINKYTPIPLGTALFLSDGIVVIAGGFIFGFESALFAIFTLYVSGQTINYMVMSLGTKYAKTAYIVSENVQVISERIIKDLGRGGTILKGTGIYTNKERSILMVVLPNTLITQAIHIATEEDERAFVFVHETYQAMGQGFKPLPKVVPPSEVRKRAAQKLQ
jgi:uncharacterized membrane-anchored protein YitT (DUF2179 family)